MRTLISFLCLWSSLGFANFGFNPQIIELEGKIINYYEVISENQDKVVLFSRGSKLQFDKETTESYISATPRLTYSGSQFAQDKWRPLPHQLTIAGQDQAVVLASFNTRVMNFDVIGNELYFNDFDLSEALTDIYRRHFDRIFNPINISSFANSLPNNRLWLSSMICTDINFARDNDEKPIRKGLRCSIDFIYDGHSSFAPEQKHFKLPQKG